MVIQPSFLATRSKTWQRCLGTALGVLFATSLIHIGGSNDRDVYANCHSL
ncbi:hypothetical protein O9929_17800 [Vibrio lentus]|nr:hypothetical protein [Vibrio lentus]